MPNTKKKKVLLLGINERKYTIKRIAEELGKKNVRNDFMKINSLVFDSGVIKNSAGGELDVTGHGAVYFCSPTYELVGKRIKEGSTFKFFEDMNVIIDFFYEKGLRIFKGNSMAKSI